MKEKGEILTAKETRENAPKITGTAQKKVFQLDEKDSELMKSLFSWSKLSEETNWVLGQPI